MRPSKNKVPKHLAIILDGNRRFSKRLMMKPWMGHEWGAKKVEKLLGWCKELGIKELTLYCFSVQNFNRPKKEFDFLMKIFNREFEKLKNDERLDKYQVRVNFIGRVYMFPKELQEKMYYIMEHTKKYKRHTINFAMAYGGREEVIDATIKIAKQIKEGKLDIKDINEKTFDKNLYTSDEPDLIIRTGGEVRTSNFLIWQAAYSEWYFMIDKLWPEFEKEDLIKCIEEYGKRDRRFGR